VSGDESLSMSSLSMTPLTYIQPIRHPDDSIPFATSGLLCLQDMGFWFGISAFLTQPAFT
jgi:hypothetical protein